MPTSKPIQIALRGATTDDREFLWWLHRATMREYVDKTWGWDEKRQRARFDECFDPLSLQIVEFDQKAIGYISVQRRAGEIFLSSIEIAPRFQNRGVATQLILELFKSGARAAALHRLPPPFPSSHASENRCKQNDPDPGIHQLINGFLPLLVGHFITLKLRNLVGAFLIQDYTRAILTARVCPLMCLARKVIQAGLSLAKRVSNLENLLTVSGWPL